MKRKLVLILGVTMAAIFFAASSVAADYCHVANKQGHAGNIGLVEVWFDLEAWDIDTLKLNGEEVDISEIKGGFADFQWYWNLEGGDNWEEWVALPDVFILPSNDALGGPFGHIPHDNQKHNNNGNGNSAGKGISYYPW